MKNYIVEAVGTFFLTLALALSGNVLAIGFVLLAVVYIGRHVSGAYYNPALALAAWLRGNLREESLIPVIAAQILGSTGALLLAHYARLGSWIPSVGGAGMHWWPFVLELLFAYLLACLLLTLYTSAQEKGNDIYGVALGLAYAGILSLGALVNPALALGSWLSAIITRSNSIANLGAYMVVLVVAPLVGAALAAYAHGYHHTTGRK